MLSQQDRPKDHAAESKHPCTTRSSSYYDSPTTRAARRRQYHTPKDRSLPTNNPKNWSVWYSLGTET